ncbi:putative E3 ubiquitin-protein ligase ARI8 [Acorus gramineus]|uniref:RBR-type E3 ubiquitin transferase n=1 Tax=Acorus gramineus TaxID=55184 RepID=A0AAV9ALH3_ACOGR|nr:putative E3 ubiquitin-protein ligase ARI8 [Acorus gramineus]
MSEVTTRPLKRLRDAQPIEDDDDDDDALMIMDFEDYEHYVLDDTINDEGSSERDQDKNYTVLTESDIRARQTHDIDTLSAVLSLSPAASAALLLHHNWCITNACESWYADEPAACARAGLSSSFESPPPSLCRICLESHARLDMSAAACGHLFCDPCWTEYIGASARDGPGCLSLRCPDPSCGAAVGLDMVGRLASAGDKELYHHYFMRSYVENNRRVKWCPAPGCRYAVEFVPAGDGLFDVRCACSHRFCWNCGEEAHRPVDCETVVEWVKKRKHMDESQSLNWIVFNSKPCPKCRRPIEKNDGCMHMTCRPPCAHEFCWVCLGTWSEHKTCAGLAAAAAPKRRKVGSLVPEWYAHYIGRSVANEASMMKAASDLRWLETEGLARLGEKQNVFDCLFVLDAWALIIECRRVLKWSYAYLYYLPREVGEGRKAFLEFLQGEAETGLEKFHKTAEEGLHAFLDAEGWREGFFDFRVKLLHLTWVTRKYYENLFKELENGNCD